jgi:hypothetical protein
MYFKFQFSEKHSYLIIVLTMNYDIFDNYYSSRLDLTLVVNYETNFNDDPLSRRSNIFVLVRKLEDFPILTTLGTLGDIIDASSGDKRLNESEISITRQLVKLFSNKRLSRVMFFTNNYVTQETSLIDLKTYLSILLADFTKKPIYEQFLYMENAINRKPAQNYISGTIEIPLRVQDIEIGELDGGEEVPLNDILLKNITNNDDIFTLNIFNINDYIDAIRKYRLALLTENEKKLGKLLHNYWLKLEISDIVKRLKTTDFDIEAFEGIQSDFKRLIKGESDFNDLFWRVKLEKGLFKTIGISFNSFILENKQNRKERSIDLYSVFKYFKLDNNVPFSRYSYGNQVGQKMVKIFEEFYSIENIKYLEKWTSTNSFRDTPSNCVQWKGFYNNLDYEVVLFNDCSYQIRLYQQRINLADIDKFLTSVSETILERIKTILYGIGVVIQLQRLELGKNIHFIFSKLEINVELSKDLEIGKLQSVLNKSSFLFDKASDIMSNEFVNLEFKKVSNYTRADQIMKYISYYIMQNRITETNELGPVIKQVMAKYNKNVVEATELVQGWIRRFVDVNNQQSRKIHIGKNIGLDVVGKQLGNTNCNFYMSNVIALEDIYTFYYYLVVLLNWSQNTENNKLYSELVGKRTDEKLLQRVQQKKDVENEVDLIGDLGDLDDLVFEDAGEDQYIFGEKGDIEENMSVHSGVEETGEGIEDVEMPSEEEEFDELKPIVNGSSYYIKRLQMMDKEIYDYKVDDKYKPYSKKAMPNDSRQPIVVSSRQMKRIRDKYGDDKNVYGGIRPDIEVYSKDYKKSSYELKYRNLFYICPKVWCMLDQMPYYMDSLMEKTSKGLVPAKIGYNEKGEFLVNPKTVVCPDCGNGLWNNDTKDGTLLIAQDNLKRQPYPGFFGPDQHPKEHCMVACFKRPEQKIDECGDAKAPKKEVKVSNEKYILKGDKIGKCSYGRYCVLPDKTHEWMNRDFGNYKNERTIVDEFISYLRKGVLTDNEEYYVSFERTLQYLLGETVFAKPSLEFRKYLVDRLKGVSDINRIFRKCRKGSLYLYFEEDIENFYKYLIETISIQPRFLLPLISYPGVITENGINFHILREISGLIYIDCEYFNYSYDESRLSADNMFIYSYSSGETYKKIFYEPIVRVQQKSKALQITRSFLGVTKHSILEDIFRYISKECIEKEDPLIAEAKLKKVTVDEYFLPREHTKSILEKLAKVPGFEVIFQYVNSYNQTEALVVKQISDNKSYYFPIKPSEILDDIKVVRSKELLELHSFIETRLFLESLAAVGIDYSPYFYTMNTDSTIVTGIYTITGEWVPTLFTGPSEDLVKGLKKWSLPKDIWVQKRVEEDERTVRKSGRYKKRYNYEKLRYEFSRLLSESSKFKESILVHMRNFKGTKDIRKQERIRKELVESISTFLRTHLVNPGVIGEWNVKDVFSYCGDNLDEEKCNTSSMCIWNTSSCRMIVNPEWYWKFISRIVDEILTNVNKRKEVLEEYRKQLEIPENEAIFFSKDEVDIFLEGYDFNQENKKYIKRPLEHFNYSNPKHPIGANNSRSNEVYKLPRYVKQLFDKSSVKDKIGVFGIRDISSNYFFKNIDEVAKALQPDKKLFVSTRNLIAQRIRKYPDGTHLLDRYKSLSEREGGEMYAKFVAMKTIEALADYVKESSWGSEIDLELLDDIHKKLKVKFIIINDTGHIDKKEPFMYLHNELEGITLEQLVDYNFVVFSKNGNRYNMLVKKDTGSPIFSADEIPFLDSWYKFWKKL